MNKQPGIKQASKQAKDNFHCCSHMAGLCSIVPLQYVLLMLTRQKRSVKYLKPIYTDCMAKISIKHLFICSGYGMAPEWCTG